MAQVETADALTRDLFVRVPPERAFTSFVNLGRWWPREYTWSHNVLHYIGIVPRGELAVLALPVGQWTQDALQVPVVPMPTELRCGTLSFARQRALASSRRVSVRSGASRLAARQERPARRG